jgi:hypothetical protein
LKSPLRQQEPYSRKTTLIIYALGGLAIAFIVFVQFSQGKTYNETVTKGVKIRTTVIDIGCTDSKRAKSRLYFRNSRNEIKHINISYLECMKYKVGEPISLYANEEGDWYEIDPNLVR